MEKRIYRTNDGRDWPRIKYWREVSMQQWDHADDHKREILMLKNRGTVFVVEAAKHD